jgi:hypothetical protein
MKSILSQEGDNRTKLVHVDRSAFVPKRTWVSIWNFVTALFLFVWICAMVWGGVLFISAQEHLAWNVFWGTAAGGFGVFFVLILKDVKSQPQDARQRILGKEALQHKRFDYRRGEVVDAKHEASCIDAIGWIVSFLLGNTSGVALARPRVEELERLAEQYAILSATELLRLDARPPVLYLRSFAAEATLKTRTGRTFAAMPRSAIQISPRLALGTALLLLSVVHSEQRFGSADCRRVFFNLTYQCAQFV